MKHKCLEILGIIFLILLALSLVLLLLFYAFSAYVHWGMRQPSPVTEIKGGFSQELLDALQSQCDIAIPENAKFIKGYNFTTWQEVYVAILFECPIDGTEQPGETTPTLVRYLMDVGSRCPEDCQDFVLELVENRAQLYEEIGGKMEWESGKGKATIHFDKYPDKLVIRLLFNSWEGSFP